MSGSGDIEAIRVAKLFGDILTLRLACNLQGDGDEDIFRRHYGQAGSFLFWQNLLSGVVRVSSFIQCVAQSRAERFDRMDVTQMALQAAIISAFQADETFFRGDLSEIASATYFHEIKRPERIKMKGREAAEWLMASPSFRHLVPKTLAAFLRGERPKQPAPLGGVRRKAKTGPKSNRAAQIQASILADLRAGRATPEELEGEKQDTLATRYEVARSTVVGALQKAVAQFEEEINSGK